MPLAEQRRELWDAAQIAEGVALITATLGRGPVGPYQLQAAIAAVHDEAASDADTDWAEILALYEVLERVSPGPIVTLNRAVAVARVHGPRAGLALLGTLDDDERMAHTHRLDAVRAHLRGALPAFATPRRILGRERLPRTSSGKIDRLRLVAGLGAPADPGAATTGDA